MYHATASCSERKPFTASVQVEGQDISMEIDIGSAVSINQRRIEGLSAASKETQQKKITNAAKKQSNIYRLDPVLRNGLIRVGRRLHEGPIHEDAKHPIIIPRNHNIVNPLPLQHVRKVMKASAP